MSLSSYDVRPARARDLVRLAAIEEAADRLFDDVIGPPDWGGPTDGRDRADRPGFVLVAGDPPVGFAHVVEVEDAAHLEQLAVHPDHLRRGHGTRLVRAAMAEAGAHRFAQLSLCTFRDVPWNAPFYRGLGFTEPERLTPFLSRVREREVRLGLDRLGARLVMVAPLRRG